LHRIYPQDNDFQGDQVPGFGYVHDGADDTSFRFHKSIGFDSLFSPNRFNDGPGGNGDQVRRQVQAFLLAFDSNLAPIVGQQVTITHRNLAAALGRLGDLRRYAQRNVASPAVELSAIMIRLHRRMVGGSGKGGGEWADEGSARESGPERR